MKLLSKNFFKKGIIIKKSFLNRNDKNRIISLINKNLLKEDAYIKDDKGLENPVFHNKLIKIRKNKSLFGEIYDKINLSAELRAIFYQDKFMKMFKSVLNSKQIYLNGFMCRFDFPKDKRNSLNWHQDSAYYLQTYPKFRAGVCWVPVTKNSFHNGTLQFYHPDKRKFVKGKFSSGDKFTTSQYIITPSKSKLNNVKNLNQKFGDASFLDMNLVHRSGINNSNKVRITIACRFHCMKNMNIGKEIFFFNEKKIRFQDKYIIKKR